MVPALKVPDLIEKALDLIQKRLEAIEKGVWTTVPRVLAASGRTVQPLLYRIGRSMVESCCLGRPMVESCCLRFLSQEN